MNVKTFYYPIAVGILVLAIVLGQYFLEKCSFRHTDRYFAQKINQNMMLKHWIKLFTMFSVVSIYPLAHGFLFWLSPPAIVTFAEISNHMSMNRNGINQLLKVWGIMTIASLIGTIFRLGLNVYMDLPLTISAIFACILMFLVYNKTKFLYPPSAGALLMPMILKPEEVMWYPLEIAIGLGILIPLAVFLFPNKCLK